MADGQGERGDHSDERGPFGTPGRGRAAPIPMQEADRTGLGRVLARMEAFVEGSGVAVPGYDESVALLDRSIERSARRSQDIDAALWAGDHARVERLTDAPATEAFEFEEDDGEWEAGSGVVEALPQAGPRDWDLDPALDARIAAIGEAGFGPERRDPLDDIAAGRPGAVDAWLAEPGPDTTPTAALFAALSAPGRSPRDIAALLAAGADVRARHPLTGDTVLVHAAGYAAHLTTTEDDERALFAALVAAGADPRSRSSRGHPPLARAILDGGPAQLAALLAAGAEPRVMLPADMHPAFLGGAGLLVLAAPKPALVRMLLDAGADPATPDANGRVPLDLIREMAAAARDRATAEDAWTRSHARALATSAELIAGRLA